MKKRKLPPKRKVHQHAYKEYDRTLTRLFSHPRLMDDLLKDFVPEVWIKDLDFSTLQKVNVKHITDKLEARESDLIWKISFAGQQIFIVCLLELQSAVYKFMSVRILTYLGLIYEDLIKQKKQGLTADGKLPPVFPLVFYTGDQPWNAVSSLTECLTRAMPKGLKKYQPDVTYFVLDLGRARTQSAKIQSNNLVRSLAELKAAQDISEMKTALCRLWDKLNDESLGELKRDMLSYIVHAMKLPQHYPDENFSELIEVGMLEESVKRWKNQLLQEGRQEGRQEGLQLSQKVLYQILLNLMKKRYSQIPDALKKHFAGASCEELKVQIEKILDEVCLAHLTD